MSLLQAEDNEIINSAHIVRATRDILYGVAGDPNIFVTITLSSPGVGTDRIIVRQGDGAARIWKLLSDHSNKCLPKDDSPGVEKE